MSTRYTAVKPLEPGKPVDVVERDESGALVGAWHGYWSFKRGTVALYPNPKNRYVAWPNGELPKKRIVSDREVTVKNAECRMQNAVSSKKQLITVFCVANAQKQGVMRARLVLTSRTTMFQE